VNEYLETSCSSVYAFGDIIGRYLFRHTANFEGEYLFNTVIQKNNIGPINYKPVPYAVFTNPQVAGVGLTEKECIAKGIAYFVGKNNYKNSAMGMALRSENGFVKLIFEKESQKLIGAHIVGKEAATMLHMLIMGMNLGVTLNDLVSMIYIHPALPEIVRNAARKALDNK
jgi:dihydrolipoamide dehydrogenase